MTVETRYMDYARVLATSQTGTGDEVSNSATGNLVVYVGIRVFKVASDGTETEITSGTPVAVISWSGNDSNWHTESATWLCPETVLVSTDKIRVKTYRKLGSGSWLHVDAKENFTTEALGTTILNNITWTVYYSIFRSYGSNKTYLDFGWDASPFLMSRVENFTYGEESAPPSNLKGYGDGLSWVVA